MLNAAVIVLIFTLVSAIGPFVYFVINGTVEDKLSTFCLQNPRFQTHSLCISCFTPKEYSQYEGTAQQQSAVSYLKNSGIWIKSKLPGQVFSTITADTTPQQHISNTDKILQRNNRIMKRGVPLRLIQIRHPHVDGLTIQCRQLIQLLNYEDYEITKRSLNQLHFQQTIGAVTEMQKIFGIRYHNEQVNSGHMFYQLSSASSASSTSSASSAPSKNAQVQDGGSPSFAVVYKIPININLVFYHNQIISVQYYTKFAVQVMQLSEVVLGLMAFVSCLIIASMKNINRQQQSTKKCIPIIINLTILLCIIGPVVFQFLQQYLGYKQWHINSKLIHSYAITLYFCLCFKKLKASRWLLLLLGILLVAQFSYWATSVIMVFATLYFIGYSIAFIEYHPFAVYLGPCLFLITFMDIYSELTHDINSVMARNIIILLSTVLIQVVDQVPMQQFQQYQANKHSDPKIGFMRIDQEQLEQERQFDETQH